MRIGGRTFFYTLPGIFLSLLCFGGLFEPALAKKADLPRLAIRNLPDNAAVKINAVQVKPDSLGFWELSPGMNAVQVESSGVVRYATAFMLKKGEEQTIILECAEKCASLDIVSEPFGASVEVNGVYEGTTPYVNGFMNPGASTLTITYVGYEPVTESIFLTPEKPTLLTYSMKPDTVYLASLQAMKLEQKKKRQFLQKLIFGGIASLMSGGAVYCDFEARHKLSLASENAVQYDRTRTNFDSFRGEYYGYRESARKALGTRDLLYIAAGACLFGFSFSFLF